MINAVNSFWVLAAWRGASAFFSYMISPVLASITMTDAARTFGATLETEPGGGATSCALGTSEIESGTSMGRTGLKLCFDLGFAATQESAARTRHSEVSVLE